MNGVEVSQDWETVTIEAGATAGKAVYEISKQTNFTRNLPVGQKPTVGMAGLTLGGGWGFFSRKQGMLCDQLVSVKMVLTDGSIVVASEEENNDLFWASCGGGGGNFGIVTEFTMRTMPVPNTATMISYHADMTPEMVAFYQDVSMKLSDRVTLNLELSNGLEHPETSSDVARSRLFANAPPLATPGEFYLEFAGIYLGSTDELGAELSAAGMSEQTPIKLSEFLLYGTDEVPVWKAQLELMGWLNSGEPDALIADYSAEETYYSYKSMMLFDELAPEAVQILLDAAWWDSDKSSLVFEFQALGGDSAVSRVQDSAFPHRNAKFGLLLKSNALEPRVSLKLYGRMVLAWQKLVELIPGNKAYANMIDPDLGLNADIAYYGVYPPTPSNGNGTDVVDRLRGIIDWANPERLLTTIQQL